MDNNTNAVIPVSVGASAVGAGGDPAAAEGHGAGPAGEQASKRTASRSGDTGGSSDVAGCGWFLGAGGSTLDDDSVGNSGTGADAETPSNMSRL